MSSYISRSRLSNRVGLISSFSFALLFLLVLIPLYGVGGVEDTSATTGVAKNSTVTFTSTRNLASVNLQNVSSSGTFNASSNDQKASFSLATNNYTGYTLAITGSSSNTALKTGSNTLSSISSTTGIEESGFTNNTWGYIPSSYRLNNTTTNNNTTRYFESPSSSFSLIMDVTTAANNVAKAYTIGLGAKVDLDTPAGTYNNTNNDNIFTIAYVANPVSYAITYDKGNTTDEVTNLPSFTGHGNTQTGSVSTTNLMLSSTIPERTGYNFTGWCKGTISTDTTNKVDSCIGTDSQTFNSGASFGIDQTTTNEATLHAMWSIKTFTLTVNNGGNTTVSGSGTYKYGEEVTLTATPTTNTTCISYSTPTWAKTTGEGTLSTTSGASVSFTMGLSNATVTATSAATNNSFTITFVTSNASSINFNGTNKANNTTGSYTCGNYSISGNYASGYEFSSWAVSGGVAFASGTSASTATGSINVTGAGTLTLNGKQSRLYMQDLTLAICPTGGTTAYDKRDEKDYTVKKINNQCWMTQNLRLTNSAGKSAGVVSATDSNFTGSDITMTSGTDFNDYTVAQYYDSGDTTKGVWYSFCAAAAKTENSCNSSGTYTGSTDICPAGWHLPTPTDYRGITSLAASDFAVTGGLYFDGSLGGTAYGYWWLATAYNANWQYYLFYSNGSLHVSNINKDAGLYIRCVRSS